MTSPDPDPRTTPGLEAGGAVPVGDTPPAASETSGLGEQPTPRGGGVTGTSLVVIAIIVAVIVACGIAGAVISLT